MANLFKSTVIVMGLAAVSKLLGFFRETAIAFQYGVSEEMDIFLVAALLPQFMSSLMQSGVIKAFVSVYHEVQNNKGAEAADAYAKTLLIFTLIFGGLLYALVDSFSVPILQAIVPGFSEDKIKFAAKLLSVMTPVFIVMASTDILSAYQQAKANFTYATSNAIVYNLLTIGFVLLFAAKDGIFALARALLISAGVQFAVQLYGSFKSGLWQQVSFTVNFPDTRKFGLLVLPLFMGIAFSQLSTVIDRMFASFLSEGSIAALNYAYKLHWLVIAFFILPLTTAFFPVMAELINKDCNLFREKAGNIISLIVFVALPISVFAIIMADPIIRLVFQRGAFNEAAVAASASVMICFLAGLVFQSSVIFFLDIAYVLQQTRLALLITAVMAGSNIAINFLLAERLGAAGLAMATSISQLFGCSALYAVLVWRYKLFKWSFYVDELRKIAVLSLVPGVMTALWQYMALSYKVKPFFSVVIGAVLFGVLYMAAAYVNQRPEITFVLNKAAAKTAKIIKWGSINGRA